MASIVLKVTENLGGVTCTTYNMDHIWLVCGGDEGLFGFRSIGHKRWWDDLKSWGWKGEFYIGFVILGLGITYVWPCLVPTTGHWLEFDLYTFWIKLSSLSIVAFTWNENFFARSYLSMTAEKRRRYGSIMMQCRWILPRKHLYIIYMLFSFFFSRGNRKSEFCTSLSL